jgi:hypothetical protein
VLTGIAVIVVLPTAKASTVRVLLLILAVAADPLLLTTEKLRSSPS